jgi:hypothetical protein
LETIITDAQQKGSPLQRLLEDLQPTSCPRPHFTCIHYPPSNTTAPVSQPGTGAQQSAASAPGPNSNPSAPPIPMSTAISEQCTRQWQQLQQWLQQQQNQQSGATGATINPENVIFYDDGFSLYNNEGSILICLDYVLIKLKQI